MQKNVEYAAEKGCESARVHIVRAREKRRAEVCTDVEYAAEICTCMQKRCKVKVALKACKIR